MQKLIYSRIKTRYDQGWVAKISDDLKEVFDTAKEYMEKKQPISIAYHGNIVDLLQYAVDNNINIEFTIRPNLLPRGI